MLLRDPVQLSRSSRHQCFASQPVCGWPLRCSTSPQPSHALQLSRSHQAGLALPCLPHPAGFRPAIQQSVAHRIRRQQQVRAAPLDILSEWKELPNWDLGCAIGVAVFAYVWVKVFNGLASAGVLNQKLSRKLVHITSGPLFVLTWPLFSDLPAAPYIAAVIPSLNMIRLLAVGSGALRDPGLVKSVSRSGDSHELLKGPLYYCLVLIGATLVFWRNNPAGLVAVSMMCGGDGLADIIGRKFGRSKLPWNSNKSWAGSGAMFLAGMAFAAGFIWLFSSLGYMQSFNQQALLPCIAAVCGACTLVESLPVNTWFDDNLSVPLVAVVASMFVLPMATTAATAGALQQPSFLQMLH